MLTDDQTKAGELFEAVRDACGEDGVSAIQDLIGGQQVFLPTKVHDDHWLAQSVGLPNAKRICRALTVIGAGQKPISFGFVVIPMGAKSVIARARAEAERLLIKGIAGREVALTVGVSERTVWRLRARLVDLGKVAANTPSTVNAAVDSLLLDGFSALEVAGRTGVPHVTVIRRRTTLINRCLLEKREIIEAAKAEINRLLLSGLSNEDVAKKVGRFVPTVLYCRRRLIEAGRLEDRP